MNGRLMVWAVVCACILAGCEGGSSVAGQPETCGSSQEEPCRVSFRALASDPDSFNGRTIRIEGYLAVAGRKFVLSASKELLEAGERINQRERIEQVKDGAVREAKATNWEFPNP